ncbi:hypothetical protein CBL_12064 [Carabus blaptoides fortunei]
MISSSWKHIFELGQMVDEAWFYLSGYVNSQNFRTWFTENPHSFVETSLHPQKIGVWVAVSRRRIIGPIFFNETIKAERYRSIILDPFIEQLHDDELANGYFQQDGATAHTANATLDYLIQQNQGGKINRLGMMSVCKGKPTGPLCPTEIETDMPSPINRGKKFNVDKQCDTVSSSLTDANLAKSAPQWYGPGKHKT